MWDFSQYGSQIALINDLGEKVSYGELQQDCEKIKSVIEKNIEKALQSINEVLEEGKDLENFLWEMIKHTKDILMYKVSKKVELYNDEEVKEIAELPDVSEGLEYAIKNAANSCNNLIDLVNIVKSKRYTQTRIQRILLYALLGITKKDMGNSKKVVPYTRVLGFNSKGKEMLSDICHINPKIQMITSVKKYTEQNTNKI